MKSVLQDWVMNLGLRHQGVLVSAVRGCDTTRRDDKSKLIVRMYRDAVLNPHVGDSTKSKSYITKTDFVLLQQWFFELSRDHDHIPHHYLMHLMHAAEVIGYHHPLDQYRDNWLTFYLRMCNKLHVNPETKEQLDARLDASEDDFGKAQDQ